MTLDLNFFMIVDGMKRRSWNSIAHARSTREETTNIELTVKSRNFNSKMVRPRCQSRTLFKFMNFNPVLHW